MSDDNGKLPWKRPENWGTTSWRKGHSGQGKGASAQLTTHEDVVRLARKRSRSAIQTLVAIMENPNQQPTARIAAANSILDRAWGKPQTQGDENAREVTVNVQTILNTLEPDEAVGPSRSRRLSQSTGEEGTTIEGVIERPLEEIDDALLDNRQTGQSGTVQTKCRSGND